MTLIQSAQLNGRGLFAYMTDALTQLPMQKNNAIDDLLNCPITGSQLNPHKV
jgi:hypothetical protein